MVATAEFDVKQAILDNGPFGPNEVKHIREAVSKDHVQLHTAPRRGQRVCKARKSRRRRAWSGWAWPCSSWAATSGPAKSSNRPTAARWPISIWPNRTSPAEATRKPSRATARRKRPATKQGSAHLGRAEALRYSGNPQGALHVLDNLFGPVEHTSDYLYQRGATVAAVGGNPQEVIALYERAVEADRGHPGALFGLALENDRYGNDETALEMYRRAAAAFPAARRLAGEPRLALRRPRAVRTGRPVLPARAGFLSRPQARRRCSSRTPRPRTSSSSTTTP